MNAKARSFAHSTQLLTTFWHQKLQHVAEMGPDGITLFRVGQSVYTCRIIPLFTREAWSTWFICKELANPALNHAAHATLLLPRIEDTDKARSTLESEEMVLRDLKWLGLSWDEGKAVWDGK
eukprot:1161066-Pelagomonas_calceolata.AAC.3